MIENGHLHVEPNYGTDAMTDRALAFLESQRPTILDLVGPPMPGNEGLPGKSVAGVLRNGEAAAHDACFVCNEYGPVRMIRAAEWKYVHRYPSEPYEPYEITNDPNEQLSILGVPSRQLAWEELRHKPSSRFVHCVDPGHDASKENIAGRGHIGVSCLEAVGKESFRQGFSYYSENKERMIDFGF